MLCLSLPQIQLQKWVLLRPLASKPHAILWSTRLTSLLSPPITLSLILQAIPFLLFFVPFKHSKCVHISGSLPLLFYMPKILLQDPCHSVPAQVSPFQRSLPGGYHCKSSPQSTSGLHLDSFFFIALIFPRDSLIDLCLVSHSLSLFIQLLVS